MENSILKLVIEIEIEARRAVHQFTFKNDLTLSKTERNKANDAFVDAINKIEEYTSAIQILKREQ
jgi:hypothetical protein